MRKLQTNKFPTRVIVDNSNANKDIFIERLDIGTWKNAPMAFTVKASNGREYRMDQLNWDITNGMFALAKGVAY